MHDVVVVGGGLVGLATAAARLRRHPGESVVVLEKEDHVAAHQSGRNSGVVHSGLYYRPGSLRARLCRAGNASVVDLAKRDGVAVAVTGKLVVATTGAEVPALADLAQRGRRNGLEVERLGPAGAADHEPHVRCLAALWVPSTGVVDFAGVARSLASEVVAGGGEVRTSAPVVGLRRDGDLTVVSTTAAELRCRLLVTCAGLHADRLARMDGVDPPVRTVPFRGEYFDLRPPAQDLVRGLVYPVPDPAFPFLGVHLTRGVDGRVHAGPNAVLALSREGYRRRDLDLPEVAGLLRDSGVRRLARTHLRTGAAEVARSLLRGLFVRDLRRLVPSITGADLEPAPAGVRAQAVARDGTLVDDFMLLSRPGAVHVLNAPSPAATACLEIGEEIARRLDACGDGPPR